ncbi:MAG: peptidoglycan DD-metalloendopeptidase family protein [Pseudomonadota bacterium]|nr:peptidoglycan DD-metalloendopeptidase family protein [Pseudomonadota bacterium]MDE3038035.1 peptidoglycan DD-metalloendopeptidase family protein [Pseudomonadota bacterium]
MLQDKSAVYPVRVVPRRTASRLSCAFLVTCGVTAVAVFFPLAPATTGLPPVVAAAPAHAAPVAPPPSVYPLALVLKAESGDTLMGILTDAGAAPDDAREAVAAVRKVYDPRKLVAGENIALKLGKGEIPGSPPVITHLKLPASPVVNIDLARLKDGSGFTAKTQDVPVKLRAVHVSGRITSSLYETADTAGLPPALIDEIIAAYSYDVDFQRDIKPGDRLDVLFDRLETNAGRRVGHGHVLFAELISGNRRLKIYRYADRHGRADYYNAKGESVRKALLRTPIPGARITSGYGMRLHPILGYSKMHRGVDFGAVTGTPIYAAGDGVVEIEGRRGGYGNYLRLRHGPKYETAYAHISRYASGIHVGSHVKQGQIVAYVGATGMATGPHLHYEVLVNGSQVNPSGVKFKTGNVLSGRDLLAFRHAVAHIKTQLAAMPAGDREKLAMNTAQN